MKTTRYLFAILISVMLCCCSEEEPIGGPIPWELHFGTYFSFIDENGEDLLREDASSNNLFQQKIYLSAGSLDCVAKWETPPYMIDLLSFQSLDECFFYVFSSSNAFDRIPDNLSFDLHKNILASLINEGKSVIVFSDWTGGGPVEDFEFEPFKHSQSYLLRIDGLNISHTITIDFTVNTYEELYSEHNNRVEPQSSTPPTYRYFLDGVETSLPITIVIPRAELANLPE